MKWLLVLLWTHAADPRTSVVFVDPAAPAISAATSFEHLPDASPKGALLPNARTLMVNVERAPLRDRSFASSLLRVEPGKNAVELCDRVVASSRPLVTTSGRVFVERGRAGVEVEGQIRVDDLTVDEVDPSTGKTRVVFRARGLKTHLAGFAAGELLIHLKGESHELLAVDEAGKLRTIARNLPPFARDFTVDGDTLVFSNRHEEDARRWVIDRVELKSGARTRLVVSDDQRLAPLPWSGDVIYHARGRLLRAGGGVFSDGMINLRAISPDNLAAALRYGNELPELILVDERGRVRQIAAPPLSHFDVVGWTR